MKFTSVQSDVVVVDVEHRQSHDAVVSFYAVLGALVDFSSVTVPDTRPFRSVKQSAAVPATVATV